MTAASVRLRVTAVAVAVTAVALVVGGWAMLRAVERTQIARIASDADEQIDDLVARLRAGAEPTEMLLPAATPFGAIVQIVDNERGDVLTAAGPGQEAFVVAAGGDAVSGAVARRTVIVADEAAGSARIEGPLPGAAQSVVELDVRFERVRANGRDLTVAVASPLAEVSRSLDAVRRSLWIGLPAVVALVGGVAWLVTGRALRPVEAMRAEVEEITHTTLHRRLSPPSTNDEIGRLAGTMNAMLDRLEAAVDRQRRFVADASHELRSPVAALRAELEVALHTGDAAALRAAVEGALEEEARIEDLLADLLVLASLDEGAARPAATAVDLRALAEAEAAVPRRVPVRVEGAGVVQGSATQLRRVLANLLDNAARHATTAVDVTVDGPRVVVDDDGPGIPEADRERVFERFTRLDEARARDHGGAGLGLALVRAVATAHGGRAWAEAAPTGGARVVVQFSSASGADLHR